MFLTDVQLAARYAVSRATIWRWSRFEDFPDPVSLSPNCTRWRLVEVEKWEAAKTEAGAA